MKIPKIEIRVTHDGKAVKVTGINSKVDIHVTFEDSRRERYLSSKLFEAEGWIWQRGFETPVRHVTVSIQGKRNLLAKWSR